MTQLEMKDSRVELVSKPYPARKARVKPEWSEWYGDAWWGVSPDKQTIAKEGREIVVVDANKLGYHYDTRYPVYLQIVAGLATYSWEIEHLEFGEECTAFLQEEKYILNLDEEE